MQELLTYNEVRPVTSRSIHLSWDFVVRFQDKAAPEKQHIQVFVTSGAVRVRPEIIDELPNVASRLIRRSGGFISFRIEHTARTWGADLEALLTNHFQSLLKPETGLKKIIRERSGTISLSIFVLFFLSVIAGVVLNITRINQERIAKLDQLYQDIQGTDLQAISVQLEYIARIVASGESVSITFYGLLFIILGFVIAIILAFWIEGAAGSTEPSFILLTKQAYKDKELTLNELQRQWLSFSVAILVSIITGIFSNYLFNFLF